jgi:uncharacterized protein YyaL (SSP411 family)
VSNRLLGETSPYLLQHAENPVDWYPWGAEAFQRAQEENKPIFLSIGYAACHWCHVMERESFEDVETAKLMNEHFINVKVDREERPDIDSLYMQAVITLSGQGGWPTSVFLTPEGEPFYGGTYYPPEPRHNLPSFRQVLLGISQAWRDDHERLLTAAGELSARIASASVLPSPADHLDPIILESAAKALFSNYDWTHGGWGGAPKFPMATVIDFLLRLHHRTADSLGRDMAIHALNKMARGGIRDHLAGGFHRYAVDRSWLVPHFEKMLYDNALLAQAYLHAWLVTGEGEFRRIADETLGFLLRDMKHSSGGFFSSLDADTEGEEGRFYVWSYDELGAALPDDKQFALFTAAFGASEAGNFEGQNILFQAKTELELADELKLDVGHVGNLLSESRQLLLQIRNDRHAPALDDKVLASWNGLLLSTLAEAARAMRDRNYLKAAQSLAAFLLEEMTVDGQLMRSWREGDARQRAFLQDHAAVGLGLLTLYQTDFNPRWYQAAVLQAEEILDHFTDPSGGFFDTRDDHEPLITRPKSLQDTPVPSANTLATKLLLTLAALSGDRRYAMASETIIRSMQADAARYPSAFSGWLSALDFVLGPQLQLAIVGQPGTPDFEALVETVQGRYHPRIVIAGSPEGVSGHPELLENRKMINDQATAYLCQGFACNLPTNSPDELSKQLEDTQ